MPQTCTLCRHPRREEIDTELVEAKATLRNTAVRFGTSPATLIRHREHLPRQLARAVEIAEATRADSLLERTRQLEDDARRLLAKAEATGDLRVAIAAVKVALDVVALLHKVADEREGILVNDPEWIGLRDRILDALEPHPEALSAVMAAIDDRPVPKALPV